MKKLILGAAALLASVSVSADVLVLNCNTEVKKNIVTYNSETNMLGLNGDDFTFVRSSSKQGVKVSNFSSPNDPNHSVLVVVSDTPSAAFQEVINGEVVQQALCSFPKTERI